MVVKDQKGFVVFRSTKGRRRLPEEMKVILWVLVQEREGLKIPNCVLRILDLESLPSDQKKWLRTELDAPTAEIYNKHFRDPWYPDFRG